VNEIIRMYKTMIEPFRIKSVEPIRMTTRLQREAFLTEARLNVFKLRAEDVLLDWLTDSGTGAMSSAQWAAIMLGDESYAGSPSFFRLEKVLKDLTGMDHFVPTHQGRAAEKVLFTAVCKKGDLVPNNCHFDTTRANLEFNGVEAVDLVIPEGLQPSLIHPFKGNIDLERVEAVLKKDAARIPFGMLTVTNNTGGGQPVSMANIRAYSQLLKKHGKPLVLDVCRFAENAMFIKMREEGYADKSVRAICEEMFGYADGATMSAKKDGMVNIGGFIMLRDDRWLESVREMLILTEGFPTYGGLAGRDLEALAVGLIEGMDEDYLRYRLRTAEYLGEKLDSFGIGYVKPTGGHAVYIDAKTVLPDMPVEHYPAWSLCNALYLEGGIRGVEVGSVMFGKKQANGSESFHSMELVRLAFPRRMYTQSHFDYAAEAIAEVKANAKLVRGVKFAKQSQYLRHFTAEFDWAALLVSATLVSGVVSAIAISRLKGTLDDRLSQVVQILERDWSDRRKTLEGTIVWFTNSGRAIQILAANDHQGAVDFGLLAMKSFRTDYFVLTQPDGTVVARAHDPNNYGDSIASQVTIKAAMAKKSAVALEEGKVVKLSLRGAVPVLDTQNELRGIVSTGFTLSQDSYVDYLKAILGAEVTIFGGDTRLATTFVDAEGKRIAGTKLENPEIENQVLKEGKPYFGSSQVEGVNYAVVFLPLRTEQQVIVGMLFAGLPLTKVEQTTTELILVAASLTAGLVLVTILLLVWYLRGKIVRPLVQTAADLQSMSLGKLPELGKDRLSRGDEIGTMTKSLEQLGDYLHAGGEVALAISEGNLAVTPRVMGAEDRFGLAFSAMVTDLNSLITGIRSMSVEVAQGIGQIADGTAGLSTGATENAASLEQMEASLAEIVSASKENATESQRAAGLSSQVNNAGQAGRDEMDTLLKAMLAIEASARDIHGVIRTIDDIAFQVNLLALNANIEAARAGKYGKGFGVVAEEVRSLAQRSAEAVKQTTAMVEEVQARIANGSNAAKATGKHLGEMAEGIEQIAGVLAEVAQRSLRQSDALSQLGDGMGQLSQVTQTNAATAEQSASVTAQLQSVANNLEEATTRFQLREEEPT